MEMEAWKHGDMEKLRHGYMETWTWRHEDIKQKMDAQVIFLNPFTHRANGSLSFVTLLMKKQTKVIHLQTD
jgi:hypothetical protein